MSRDNIKEAYLAFSNNEADIPVYSRPWYLDAVCGENGWEVLLYYKDENILASMPYYTTSRLGSKVIKMPPLTQTLGVFMKYPENLDSNGSLALKRRFTLTS